MLHWCIAEELIQLTSWVERILAERYSINEHVIASSKILQGYSVICFSNFMEWMTVSEMDKKHWPATSTRQEYPSRWLCLLWILAAAGFRFPSSFETSSLAFSTDGLMGVDLAPWNSCHRQSVAPGSSRCAPEVAPTGCAWVTPLGVSRRAFFTGVFGVAVVSCSIWSPQKIGIFRRVVVDGYNFLLGKKDERRSHWNSTETVGMRSGKKLTRNPPSIPNHQVVLPTKLSPIPDLYEGNRSTGTLIVCRKELWGKNCYK